MATTTVRPTKAVLSSANDPAGGNATVDIAKGGARGSMKTSAPMHLWVPRTHGVCSKKSPRRAAVVSPTAPNVSPTTAAAKGLPSHVDENVRSPPFDKSLKQTPSGDEAAQMPRAPSSKLLKPKNDMFLQSAPVSICAAPPMAVLPTTSEGSLGEAEQSSDIPSLPSLTEIPSEASIGSLDEFPASIGNRPRKTYRKGNVVPTRDVPPLDQWDDGEDGEENKQELDAKLEAPRAVEGEEQKREQEAKKQLTVADIETAAIVSDQARAAEKLKRLNVNAESFTPVSVPRELSRESLYGATPMEMGSLPDLPSSLSIASVPSVHMGYESSSGSLPFEPSFVGRLLESDTSSATVSPENSGCEWQGAGVAYQSTVPVVTVNPPPPLFFHATHVSMPPVASPCTPVSPAFTASPFSPVTPLQMVHPQSPAAATCSSPQGDFWVPIGPSAYPYTQIPPLHNPHQHVYAQPPPPAPPQQQQQMPHQYAPMQAVPVTYHLMPQPPTALPMSQCQAILVPQQPLRPSPQQHAAATAQEPVSFPQRSYVGAQPRSPPKPSPLGQTVNKATALSDTALAREIKKDLGIAVEAEHSSGSVGTAECECAPGAVEEQGDVGADVDGNGEQPMRKRRQHRGMRSLQRRRERRQARRVRWLAALAERNGEDLPRNHEGPDSADEGEEGLEREEDDVRPLTPEQQPLQDSPRAVS